MGRNIQKPKYNLGDQIVGKRYMRLVWEKVHKEGCTGVVTKTSGKWCKESYEAICECSSENVTYFDIASDVVVIGGIAFDEEELMWKYNNGCSHYILEKDILFKLN